MRKKSSVQKHFRTPVLMITALILSIQMLAGCQNPFAEETIPSTAAPATVPQVTAPPETQAPLPTEPVVQNPEEVTAKGSYTVSDNEAVVAAHNRVATAGEQVMENADLQVYYWMAVNAYRQAGHETAPDFGKPLDTQMCPLGEGNLTWQQYFLEQAVHTWHCFQALLLTSQDYDMPLEEAYKPNEKKHKENLQKEIYNADVLYGYDPKYKISEEHKAYLKELPELMEQLAQEGGYDSLASLTRDLAGMGTTTDYLTEYAELCNQGYMFATALSFTIEPKDEDVEAHFTANQDAYAQAGITKDSGKYVNIRQILVVPEDGKTGEDGTVTYSKGAWDEAQSQANALLRKWKSKKTEVYFGELAFANSDDTGSNGLGGLYSGISKGQLTAEMDAWCFDAERKPGDTTVMKTDSGYHVLYFSGETPIWFAQAQRDLKNKLLMDQISAAMEKYPITVDYGAAALGLASGSKAAFGVDQILFPDVAYQRFPTAPLYLQQDYEGTMYGRFPLRTYGCGVTTMAMLTSYMTDDEWTPPEMCALYGRYCSEDGTAHKMFAEVPSDRGFYMIERTQSWDTALKALQDGYMVVTLQHTGFWTGAGHYLLLHNLVETKDGVKLQVRDSNIFNYKKLEGHITGYFDLETIAPNARIYWIYQKKVIHVDSCARCGQPTENSVIPGTMFGTPYYCPKCVNAMSRRSAYLDFVLGGN